MFAISLLLASAEAQVSTQITYADAQTALDESIFAVILPSSGDTVNVWFSPLETGTLGFTFGDSEKNVPVVSGEDQTIAIPVGYGYDDDIVIFSNSIEVARIHVTTGPDPGVPIYVEGQTAIQEGANPLRYEVLTNRNWIKIFYTPTETGTFSFKYGDDGVATSDITSLGPEKESVIKVGQGYDDDVIAELNGVEVARIHVTIAPASPAIQADSFRVADTTDADTLRVTFVPLKEGTFTVTAGDASETAVVSAEDVTSAVKEIAITVGLGFDDDVILSFGGKDVARIHVTTGPDPNAPSYIPGQSAIEAGSLRYQLNTAGDRINIIFTPLKVGSYAFEYGDGGVSFTADVTHINESQGLFDVLIGYGYDDDVVVSFDSEEVAKIPVTTLTAPPSAPVIGTGDIFSTNIEITWNAVEGATSYAVYRDGANRGNTDDTSFIVYGLTPGIEYTFSVVARNDIGQTSAFSTPLKVTTTPAPASFNAATPTYADTQTAIEDGTISIETNGSNGDQINISFTPLQVGVYHIEYGAFNTENVSVSQTGTHKVVPPITIGYGFDQDIVIFFRDGVSDRVEVARAHVTTGPEPPTVTATRQADNSIRLEWSNIPTDYQYRILLKEGTTISDRIFDLEPTSNNFVIIPTVTTFFERINSADEIGMASITSSNVIGSITFAPVPPLTPNATVEPTITATRQADNSILLEWSNLPTVTANGYTSFTIKDGTTKFLQTIPGTDNNHTWLTTDSKFDELTNEEEIGISGRINTFIDAAETVRIFAPVPAPAPPVLVKGVVTHNSIEISWNAQGGDPEYKLYRNNALIETTRDTSYTDTTVTPGTSYTYHATSTNTVGASDSSEDLTVTTPAAPIELVAGIITPTSIGLTWDTVPGAFNYALTRSDLPGVQVIGGTSHNDVSLTPETVYIYSVVAVDSAPSTIARSANLIVATSSTASPDTPADIPPIASGSFSVIAVDDGTASAYFTPLKSGDFTIGYSTDQSINVNIADTVLGVKSTTTLPVESDYSGIVTLSFGGEVIGSVSIIIPPATPVFSAGATTDTTITLSWGAVTNADSYTLTRIVDGSANVPVPITDALTATDTGLTADTPYKYTITATNAAGTSEPSAEFPASTASHTYTLTSAPHTDGDKVVITFTSSHPGNFVIEFENGSIINFRIGDASIPNIHIETVGYDYTGNVIISISGGAEVARESVTTGPEPDDTAPEAPIITTSPATVNTQSFTIEGTAEAGTTVALLKGGTSTGDTVTADSGSFSFTVTLTEGANSFTVTASDGSNTSDASSAIFITLDTIPPEAPIITTSPATVNTQSFTIEGTAEAGTTVELFKGATSVDTVIADTGNFSFTVTLTDGENSFTTTASDGPNTSDASPALVITLDTIPPVITVNPLTVTLQAGSAQPNLLEGVRTDDDSIVTTTGDVNIDTPDDYIITYNSVDASNNAANPATRTYTVTTASAPATPALGIASNTHNTIELAWGAVANAKTYTLTRIVDGGDNVVVESGDILSATDRNLTPSTNYKYVIVATNAAGTSTPSAEFAASTTAAPTVPGTPTLVAGAVTHDSISLSWDGQTGATGYTLSRTGGTGPIEIPVVGTGISYTDDTLEPETSYTYSIRAVAAAGFSASSDDITVTTIPIPIPVTTPTYATDQFVIEDTSFEVFILSDGITAQISFEPYELDSYHVEWGGNTKDIPVTGDHALVQITLGPTFTGNVILFHNSVEVVRQHVTTIVVDPIKAGTLAFADNADGTITVSFTPVLAGTFIINANSIVPIEKIVETGQIDIPITVTIRDADPGFAEDIFILFNGDVIARESVTTVPETPTLLLGAVTPTSITLSWNSVNNAETYTLTRVVDSINDVTVASGDIFTATDENLTAETEYNYIITATTPDGKTSAPSAQFAVTISSAAQSFDVTADGDEATVSFVPIISGEFTIKYGDQSIPVTIADGDEGSVSTTIVPVGYNFNRTVALFFGSDVIDSIPINTEPAPPTIKATTITPTSIEFAWEEPTGAQEYKLYRDGTLIVTTPDVSYTDVSLEPETIYIYRVESHNDISQTSDTSANLVVSTSSTATPGTPIEIPAIQEPFAIEIRAVDVLISFVPLKSGDFIIGYGTDQSITVSITNDELGETSSTLVPVGYSYNGDITLSFDSVPVDSLSIRTPPAPPILRVGAVTPTSITIEWDAVDGAIGYLIYDDPTVLHIRLNTVTELSFYIPDLTPETSYTYYVRSVNPTGIGNGIQGSEFAEFSATTAAAPTAPATPVLSVDSTTDTTVSLSWGTVGNANSYTLTRTLAGSADGTEALSGDATTFTDENLTADTEYKYSLIATNSVGPSESSNEVTASTDETPDTTAPTLTVERLANDFIRLSWENVPSVEGTYIIYLDTGDSESTLAEVFTDSHIISLSTDLELANAADRIGVTGDTGTQGTGSSFTILYEGDTVWEDIPAKNAVASEPPVLVKGAVTDTSIVISWDIVDGATGYELFRDDVSIATTTTELSHTDDELTPGKSYTYHATATNSAGPSDASKDLTAATTIAPPVLVKGAVTDTTVIITWTAIHGAADYLLYQDNSATPIATVTGTTHTVTGLTAGTDYSFAAESRSSDSVKSSPSSALPVLTVPAAPALGTGAITDTSIVITWDVVEGATGYELFRDDVSIATTTTELSHTDTTVTPGKFYTYHATATNAAGSSEDSDDLDVATTLAAPVLMKGAVTDTSVTITWTAIHGAADYFLHLEGSRPITVIGTTHTYINLTPGTTYSFTVESYNSDRTVKSQPSAPLSVTTSPATPTLRITDTAHNTITLSWDRVGADSYTLTRIVAGGANVEVPTTDALTATDTGLTAETPYRYVITATNAAGTSGSSNEVTARTDAAPDITAPPVPTITTPSATVNSTPITIEGGSTEAGATIELFRGTTSLGTTTADGSGNFSFTGVALDEGVNSFTATASDRVNTSAASSAIVITLDTIAPAVPEITTSPATVNTQSFTIEGTAEAGTTVALFNGVTPAGTTIADGSGNFSFTGVALDEGANSFTATASDGVNTSAASSALVITLDTEKPVITVSGSSETIELTQTNTYTIPDATVEDNDPAYSGTVTVTDDAPNSSVIGVYAVLYDAPADTAGNTPDQQSITITVSDTTPPTFDVDGKTADYSTAVPFGGTYAPGAINNQSDISVIASSIVVGDDLVNVNTSGEYIVTYTVTDSNGQTTTITETVTVGPDVTAPAVPEITTSPATVNTQSFTIEGTAEAGTTVALFNGGTSAGTVIADGDGNFSFTGVALDEGANSFTATASDGVNTSAASSAIVITLDTETPPVPAITTSPATVNTQTITIEGTAEAGTTVALFNGGTSAGTVIADGDGNFSFTGVALDEGANSFTATASDRVNTSDASPALVITLDTIPPVITVNPLTVTLQAGSAQPNLLEGVRTDDDSIVTTTGDVNIDTPDDYIITYNSVDASNNAANPATRTYTVTTASAPATPALGIASNTHNTIELAWGAVANAKTYTLTRIVDGGDNVVVESGDILSATDRNLTPSTNYKYVIVATNAAGTSTPSAEFAASTTAAPVETPAIKAGSFEVTHTANADKLLVTFTALKEGTFTITSSESSDTVAVSAEDVSDSAVKESTITVGYDFDGDVTLSFDSKDVASQSARTLAIKAGTFIATAHDDGDVTVSFVPLRAGTFLIQAVGGPSTLWTINTDEVGNATENITLSTGHGFIGEIVISFGGHEYARESVSTIPGTPTLVKGDITHNSVVFSWDEQTGATGYTLSRTVNTVTTEISVSGGTISYTDDTLEPATTYTYSIKAVALAGDSAASDVVSVTTLAAPTVAPTVPEIPVLSVDSTTDTTISLSWVAVDDADSYTVTRIVAGGNVDVPITELTATDTGLTADTPYKYTIIATNSAGPSGSSNEVTARTDAATPPAPPALRSGEITSTSIVITWDAVTGATGYELFRDGNSVTTTTELSYTDETLTPASTYTYHATATNSVGTSEDSANRAVTTARAYTLPAPPVLVKEAINSTSIVIVWDAQPGAFFYKLYRDDILIRAISGLNHTNTGLDPGTSYTYHATSNNRASQASDNSEDLVAVTTIAPPELVAGAITETSIEITWTAVNGATGYELFRDDAFLETVTELYYPDTGLTPATSYTYHAVSTNDISQTGEPSANLVAVTTIAPPTLRPGAITETSIVIEWDAQTGATGYELFRDDVSLGPVTGTSYSDTAVTPGTSYTYHATSTNDIPQTSDNSADLEISTTITPPTLRPGAITETSIMIEWDAQTGATGYELFRDDVSLGPVTELSYPDAGLTPETIYIYHATSTNDISQTSEPSANLVVSTSSTATPGTPIEIPPIASGSFGVIAGVNDASVSFVPLKSGDFIIAYGTDQRTVSIANDELGETSTTIVPVGYNYDGDVSLSFDGAQVGSVSVTTGPAPPALVLGEITPTSVVISWDIVTGATEYELFRDDASLGPVTELSYTDNIVTPGTSYTYHATATNAAGTSVPSEDLDAVTTIVPSVLSAGEITDTSVIITWTAPTGATEYSLFNGNTLVIRTSALTHTVDNLTAETNYTFTITSHSDTYTGVPSAGLDVTTAGAPATPALVLGEVTETSITLSWDAVDNANSYTLIRIVDGISDVTLASGIILTATDTGKVLGVTHGDIIVASGDILTATDTGLIANTDYNYIITATNSAGPSAPSAKFAASTTVASTDTIPAAPTLRAGKIITESSIEIEWSAVDGALVYSLYRDGEFIANTADTSYTDTGLDPYTSYAYHAMLSNIAFQQSGKSGVLILTTSPIQTGSFSVTVDGDEATVSFTPLTYGDFTIGYGGTTDTVPIASGDAGSESSTTVPVGYDYDGTVTLSFDGDELGSIPIRTEPAPPTLRAGTITYTTIEILWDAVDGAREYTVYRDDAYQGSRTTPSYLDSTIAPGTYTYRIESHNDVSQTSDSSTLTLSTATVPITPALVKGAVTHDTIALSWGAVDDADSYTLTRIVEGGTNVPVQTTGLTATDTGLTATDTGLTADTEYKYSLIATNSVGPSEPSEVTATTAVATAVPAAPALVLGKVTDTTVALSWGKVDNTVAYTLSRTLAGSTDGTEVLSGNALTFTDENLAADTEYKYSLIATNSAGPGAADEVTARTAAAPIAPTAPDAAIVTLEEIAVTHDSVTISWNEVDDVNFYRLFRDTVQIDIVNAGVHRDNGFQYLDEDVTPDTSYSYHVIAIKSGLLEGIPSVPLDVTTTSATAPITPTLSEDSVTHNTITLSWNSVDNADSYTLTRVVAGGDDVKVLSGNVLTATDDNLTADTEYKYIIMATNTAGTSTAGELIASTDPLKPGPSPAVYTSSDAPHATDGDKVVITFRSSHTGDFTIEFEGGRTIGFTIDDAAVPFIHTETVGYDYTGNVRIFLGNGEVAKLSVTTGPEPTGPKPTVDAVRNTDNSVTVYWSNIDTNAPNQYSFIIHDGGSSDSFSATGGPNEFTIRTTTNIDLNDADRVCIKGVGVDNEICEPVPEAFDITAPVITVTGSDTTIELTATDTYTIPGATVADNDPNYSETVAVTGDTPDTSVVDVYTVLYDAPNDAAGNKPEQKSIVITVVDTTPPTFNVDGNTVDYSTAVPFGGPYTPGAINNAFDISGTAPGIVGGDTVNVNTSGEYVVTYTVTDSNGLPTIITETVTVGPEPTVPAAPVLSAGATTDTTILLSWVAVDNTDSYTLSRTGGAEPAEIPVSGGTTISYTDENLTAETDYKYTIIATNTVGPSTASNEVTATTLATPTVPAAPVLVAGATTDTSITLSWGTADNVDSYTLSRTLAGSADDTETLSGDATTFTDENLTADTEYKYTIIATNSVGPSASSNEVTATTPAATDTAPSAIRPGSFGIDYYSTSNDAFVSFVPLRSGDFTIEYGTDQSITVRITDSDLRDKSTTTVPVGPGYNGKIFILFDGESVARTFIHQS